MTDHARRFEIRIAPWSRWLLRVAGVGGPRSGLFLAPETVTVRAGGFRVAIPRSDIADVGRARAPWWALGGVHTTLRGRWIVNGASGQVVRLDLSRPVEGRMAGFRTRVRRLDVGLVDDDALLEALHPRHAG